MDRDPELGDRVRVEFNGRLDSIDLVADRRLVRADCGDKAFIPRCASVRVYAPVLKVGDTVHAGDPEPPKGTVLRSTHAYVIKHGRDGWVYAGSSTLFKWEDIPLHGPWKVLYLPGDQS